MTVPADQDGQSQLFVLVTPRSRRRDTCLLWVAGYGRYFSHTSARGDFPGADLCGLDLPRYGRAYAACGFDAIGNELMSVPEPGTRVKWVDFYHQAYQGALQKLGELGYKKVVFMCNSTAGLTFQCFAVDVLAMQDSSPPNGAARVAGVIYTAPFWVSSSPVFRHLPYGFWWGLAWLFPKLILFCDDVMPPGELASHDKRFQAAQASGRDIFVDPYLNPTENAPYYVEWFCMVVEAQIYLQRSAASHRGPARSDKLRALLLTTQEQTDEPHVHLDECHDLFAKLYPDGEARRLAGLNHEAMLSEESPYREAIRVINTFLEGV